MRNSCCLQLTVSTCKNIKHDPTPSKKYNTEEEPPRNSLLCDALQGTSFSPQQSSTQGIGRDALLDILDPRYKHTALKKRFGVLHRKYANIQQHMHTQHERAEYTHTAQSMHEVVLIASPLTSPLHHHRCSLSSLQT